MEAKRIARSDPKPSMEDVVELTPNTESTNSSRAGEAWGQ